MSAQSRPPSDTGNRRGSRPQPIRVLEFPIHDALLQIVAHAAAGPTWVPPYGKTEAFPCAYLVHDDGIYLMSGRATPNPATDAPPEGDGSTSQRVVYARGCDPSRDPSCRDTSRALVGGNDFAQAIPLEAIRQLVDDPESRVLVFEATQTHFHIRALQAEAGDEAARPPSPAAPA